MAGTRLQEFREAAKLSRGELAEVIGEDESAIERYEAGEPIPPGVAQKVAAMFAVPVAFLQGED